MSGAAALERRDYRCLFPESASRLPAALWLLRLWERLDARWSVCVWTRVSDVLSQTDATSRRGRPGNAVSV